MKARMEQTWINRSSRVFQRSKCVKSYAVKTDNDRFEIRFGFCDFNFNKDQIMNIIDIELEEMNNGERVILWSDLIELVK